MFLSMIDGYNSTVNTDQRLSAGEITYQWLLLKSGSVIYMVCFFFDRPLGLFALLTRKFRLINFVAAIIVFFFSLQPTCFDLSYLECLSMLDSHKTVEKRLTFLFRMY